MRGVLIALFLLVSFSGAWAVHDEFTKVGCIDCHTRLPFSKAPLSFQERIGEVCERCHRDHHGRPVRFAHPVDIVPTMAVPKDMPLDSEGKMTCITCHSFHDGYRDEEGKKKFFLRRTRGKTFCYSCHNKPLF